MKTTPCIRSLPEFKKSGCPQKEWDGKEGCPAWKELILSTKGNPQQKEAKKQCIDLWMFEFTWASLGTMEGVQIATEANRNVTAAMALTISQKMGASQLYNTAEKHYEIEDKG